MLDRKSLVSTLWLFASLAMLASVLVAPTRTARFATASSRPVGLRHAFVLPQGQPSTRLGAAIATESVQQVKALPTENEEQDRADALDEPRVPFLIPCSFRKIPDRQFISPRHISSRYPLRC